MCGQFFQSAVREKRMLFHCSQCREWEQARVSARCQVQKICVLIALGRGSLQQLLSTTWLQARGNLLQRCLDLLHLSLISQCSSECHCQTPASLVGSRATCLVRGRRDSPPNALYSPLCCLLQQMTRSQQMDELLDVLIESGGTHCFSDPSRASPQV